MSQPVVPKRMISQDGVEFHKPYSKPTIATSMQSTNVPMVGEVLDKSELPIINFSNPTLGYLPMSALKFKRPFI